ncbi:MAG: chorismate synthase [Candidatus Peregrinibacteria bacterium]|nr:chorismate synthase [Candidatus Peregrinibacteria bacterium]
MAGNTFGTLFRITTWGESHGPATGVVIDGCPAGLYLNEADIQKEVDRRRPALGSKIATARRENDQVQILSGVFEGKTTGMPISLMVNNEDTRSKDYSNIQDKYRPAHADYTYDLKYGFRDYRGGGRSSGRETLARVMAGAIAKKILTQKAKTMIFGHTIQVGDIKTKNFDKSEIEKNELRCADPMAAVKMQKMIEKLRFTEGDSVGAIIEIIIKNPPKGLGEPVFDKLDADLAKAMMSIGAIKAIEIGAGFEAAAMKGSQNNDQMEKKGGKVKFLTNNSGGILGGISTGEDILIRLGIKPVPSISKSLKTITKSGENAEIATLGRHDCCLAPRIIPVAESMAALVLVDKWLEQMVQNSLR